MVAETPLRVRVIGRAEFDRLVGEHPEPAQSLLRPFARRFTLHRMFDLHHGALTPPMLMGAPSPIAILTAQDDTVIPFADFAGLGQRGSVVAFDAPRRGGHCGFIENLRLESWAEKRVVELLSRL